MQGEKSLIMDPDLKSFFHVVCPRMEAIPGKPKPEDPINDNIKDTSILEVGYNIDEKVLEQPIILFMLKANYKLIRVIIDLCECIPTDKRILIIFIPQYTITCREMFEEGKVLKRIEVHELAFELLPLEKDVLTLDDENSFRNLALGYNFNIFSVIKHSIQRLEALYGKIPLKFAKGKWSCTILDAMHLKEAKENDEIQSPEIDALVLMDRTVDLYSVLLTQMTYEGIVDEFFSIKTATIEVKEKIVNPETTNEGKLRTLYMTSEDDIMFKETRDLHFNLMKEQFPKKYEEIKSVLEKKETKMSVAEMTEYVKKMRSLNIYKLKNVFHVDLNLLSYLDEQVRSQTFKQMVTMEAQAIVNEEGQKELAQSLEFEILKCREKTRLLRVLCLLSLVMNGLPKDLYNTLTKIFVEAFGISEVLRIMNLEKAGILRKDRTGSSWKSIKDTFKLIDENTKILNPDDIRYSYTVYGPLSVRLIENLLETGWSGSDSNV